MRPPAPFTALVDLSTRVLPMAHPKRFLAPILILLCISVTHALPFLIRQSSPTRGACPSSSRSCRLTDSCCPNNICCPSRTPFCTTSNFCVDSRGRTRCPSAETGRFVLGTLCTSNTSNCCTPPFEFCSQENPVRCVNRDGMVRCIDRATGEAKPGVLCPDGVCCIDQQCCRTDDNSYSCCPSGNAGRTLVRAPRETGFPGTAPSPIPSPSPMGPVETPSSSPSVMPTSGPQEPDSPTAGNGPGMEDLFPTMTVEPSMNIDAVISPTADAAAGDEDGEGGDGDDGDDGICLPASAKVEVYGKGPICVEDVQTGDMVRVGSGIFSRVFMWTHRDGQYEGNRFVRIMAAEKVVMTATEGHMVYVCRDMKKGCVREMSVVEDVRIGDGVWRVDGGEEQVVRVMDLKRGVRARGLFNPQTEHGDLVVDGMLATCYTKFVPVSAAHALLAPVRAMFRGGLSVVEEI
eukprot:GFKZ01012538.1.p1 GENE.GFKZ01012538.1~~GFKZ01012538.1.p1  ORF type:complete len:461 (-),score=32.68 GFKZ01012538.1:327-1709(-)